MSVPVERRGRCVRGLRSRLHAHEGEPCGAVEEGGSGVSLRTRVAGRCPNGPRVERLASGAGSGRSRRETCSGCMVLLAALTNSTRRACRSVSLRSFAEKLRGSFWRCTSLCRQSTCGEQYEHQHDKFEAENPKRIAQDYRLTCRQRPRCHQQRVRSEE